MWPQVLSAVLVVVPDNKDNGRRHGAGSSTDQLTDAGLTTHTGDHW